MSKYPPQNHMAMSEETVKARVLESKVITNGCETMSNNINISLPNDD